MNGTFFRFIRVHIWLVIFALTLLFAVVAWAVPNIVLLIFLRAGQLTFSFVAIWFLRQAFSSAWKVGADLREADVFTFGTILLHFSVGTNAIWLLLWRVVDEPVWMINSAVNGYFVGLTILAAILQMAGPSAEKGALSRKTLGGIVLSSISAILLVLAMFYFEPELRKFVDRVRIFAEGDDYIPTYLLEKQQDMREKKR